MSEPDESGTVLTGGRQVRSTLPKPVTPCGHGGAIDITGLDSAMLVLLCNECRKAYPVPRPDATHPIPPTPPGSSLCGVTGQARGASCSDSCRRPSPSQAHCGACHTTFGGVSGFDRHRRGGECLAPAGLGFVERDRVWRAPLDEGGRERLASVRGIVDGGQT